MLETMFIPFLMKTQQLIKGFRLFADTKEKF